LFSGILIVLMSTISTVESDSADVADVDTMGVLIVAINCVTMVWPLVRKVLVGKHAEYYEKTMWVLGCPRQFYMSYCGGEKRAAEQRQREKEARAAARRAAGVRRDGSIQAMLPEGTPSNAQINNLGLPLQGEAPAVFQQQDIETGTARVHCRQVSIRPAAALLGFPEEKQSNVELLHVVDQVVREMSIEEGPFSPNKFLRRLCELQKEENDINRQLRPQERATRRKASQDVQEGMGAGASLGVSGTLPAAESGYSPHTRQGQTFTI